MKIEKKNYDYLVLISYNYVIISCYIIGILLNYIKKCNEVVEKKYFGLVKDFYNKINNINLAFIYFFLKLVKFI